MATDVRTRKTEALEQKGTPLRAAPKKKAPHGICVLARPAVIFGERLRTVYGAPEKD